MEKIIDKVNEMIDAKKWDHDNEALLIWGVGGTIDYIQDSDKLRELPDKCVEALDLWIESITENK